MKLLRLELRNFKGIQHFVLEPNGRNVNVYGDNATGKTTLMDAFMWLLFDKDSHNRADFQIKTLGPDGEPLHGLDHEVEATLEVNGQVITLKKVYREKWTKKRGQSKAVLTGHTVDHFIDGVPVKKGEYEQKIKSLVDENVFRLLTDPLHFNEHLHWTKRRSLLLEICGDVTDEDVIASSSRLAALPEILGNVSVEKKREMIRARRKEINEQLDKLPVRIDEVTRGLPEVDGDPAAIQAEIDSLNEQRKALEAELARIDHGAEVVEKQKRIREIEIELLNLRQIVQADTDRAIEEERQKLAQKTDKLDAIGREISHMQALQRQENSQIETLNARLERLRQEYKEINGRQFVDTTNDTCPACGQALPPEQVEEARAKALAEFNAKKAAELEANITEGKRLKAELDALLQKQKEREQQIENLQALHQQYQEEVVEIKERIEQLRRQVPDVTQHPDFLRLNEERARLEQEIATIRQDAEAAKTAVREKIAEVLQQVNDRMAQLAKFEARENGLKRIQELQEQERALASEYEQLEEELFLLEEFTRTKVRLLEEKINSRFKLARFKLFRVLVNGEVEECCEVTYNGVPFGNLNTGARLNVGMDIINVLAEHFGFAPVVWIDNAESVTNIIPTQGQQVRLVVSAPDKKLRVEIQEVKEAA